VSRNVARTVLLEVLTPIAVYLLLVRLGVSPVWALVGSAGVSVVVLGVGWLRTRTLSTLGLLVLAQFALGVAIAVLTGDARFVLAKDYLVTLLVALAAAGSLRLRRPFIARVRRDLSADPHRFDEQWDSSPAFRRVHRQLTWAWVAGLAGQAVVAIVVIYSVPLTAAVVATNVLTPVVLLGLITLTEARARAVDPTRPV
jgi:intracellular septation protein A